MKRLYRFLGSLPFALLLISFSILIVILGTVIEAKTESHKFAASFTYNSPAFAAVLAGFFLNILISALHRWPFKKRHIPFLATHLGLLMIIGGTLIKIYFGIQGRMILVEGSGSSQVLIPDSYALLIEERTSHGIVSRQAPIHALPELDGIFPHGKERYGTWIKEGKVEIAGLKPIAGYGAVMFGEEVWKVALEKTDAPEKLAEKYHAEKEPVLLITEDKEGSATVFACGKEEGIAKESYPADRLARYISYDDGFLGYTVPFKMRIEDRQAALKLVGDYLQKNSDLSGLDMLMEQAKKLTSKEIVLETALRPIHIPEEPQVKLEENRPIALLTIAGKQISLAYERNGTGLKWPANGGKWRIRFQPEYVEIPYRLRLRDARRLCYPGTGQPFSYEADILVTDLKSGRQIEKTLSMNHVYETAEGYRFYLSGIAPGDETSIERIQLAVNYDPARWRLTYPGALLAALGAFSLFWLRRFFS